MLRVCLRTYCLFAYGASERLRNGHFEKQVADLAAEASSDEYFVRKREANESGVVDALFSCCYGKGRATDESQLERTLAALAQAYQNNDKPIISLGSIAIIPSSAPLFENLLDAYIMRIMSAMSNSDLSPCQFIF